MSDIPPFCELILKAFLVVEDKQWYAKTAIAVRKQYLDTLTAMEVDSVRKDIIVAVSLELELCNWLISK